MTFPLKALLNLRENREKQALGEYQACQQRLEQALIRHQEEEVALAHYIRERRATEAQLEQQFLGCHLEKHQLDHWQERLKWMRESQQQLTQTVAQTKERIVAHQQALETARQKRLDAHLARQKIVIQQENWLANARAERDRKEQQELEEVIRPRSISL